jgi:hypothetical protein
MVQVISVGKSFWKGMGHATMQLDTLESFPRISVPRLGDLAGQSSSQPAPVIDESDTLIVNRHHRETTCK